MKPPILERVLGPRVSREELASHRVRFALPTALIVVAAMLLVISILTPYWKMTLHAPQYPRGLHVRAFVDRLEGDVAEIDGLNHYIGMRPLEEAAELERTVAVQAIGVVACLVLAATLVHTRYAALLALPALLFPFGFLADLQFWLWNFGQHLDPKAPLSSSVKPFIPPVLGVGRVGQFETVAGPDVGLILATTASGFVLVGLWAHRRAYKPLVDRGARRVVALTLVFVLAGSPGAARGAQELSLRDRIAAAAPGDTLIVEPGVHEAPLLLDKPIVLEGRAGAVVQGDGSGDLLRITSPDVVIRGLVIRGTGSSLDQENAAVLVLAPRVRLENNTLEDDLFGFYLRDAPDCVLRANRIVGKDLDIARRGDAIRLWNSDRCLLQENEIEHTRDVIIWYSKDVHIIDNRIRDSRYGLHFMYANSNVVRGNRLEGNSVGAFLMYSKDLVFRDNVLLRNRGPSGYGLGMKDVDGVDARGNLVLGNRVGLYIDNSPFTPTTYHDMSENIVAFNDIGVTFQPAVQRNRFTNNAFLENLEQVSIAGSGELRGNEFTVAGRGNYWSDYRGFDLADDGIGDVAHRSESLFETLIDRDTKLRLFLFSPAQQAVELASAALPAFRPRPKFVDTAPLVRIPSITAPQLPHEAAWPLGALSCVFLAGSIATMGAGRRRETSAVVHVERAAPPTPLPAGKLLRIEGLTKRFGSLVAVDDLTFDVYHGEAVAFWGRNGAGKTTAIKLLLGLHRGAGRVLVNGFDLNRYGKSARASIGYVPQELALPSDLGTREALEFYARLKKVTRERIQEAVDEVGMREHLDKRIGELSGGMKQRIALAVALLSDPPLLVLDEMTSNLDAAARADFVELLLRQKRRGKTILFTTHRPDEVQTLADRVLLLDRGRLVHECPVASFAAAIGLYCELRLHFAADAGSAAAEFLRGLAVDVLSESREVVTVRLAPGSKAGVLRELDRSGHRVVDFDIEEGVAHGAR